MALESLLDNLVVQTAVAPLLVALVTGLAMRILAPGLTGLAMTLGFITAAYLINGMDWQRLGGVDKIVFATAAAALVGLACKLTGLPAKPRRALLVTLALLVTAWMSYKALATKEGLSLVIYSLGGAAYVAWMTFMLDRLHNRATAIGVLIPLALGTGFCAIAGASALMGQLSLAMAAAAGGLGLLFLVPGSYRVGADLTFPAALACGLLGFGAWLFASLPWYALPILAAVPLVSFLPGLQRSYWIAAAGYMFAGLLVAGTALLLIRQLAGDSYGY